NLAIVDSSQIPDGMSWEKFFEITIKEVKEECKLDFVFFDVMDFISSEKDNLIPVLDKISFMDRFTKIIIITAGAPVFTAIQDPKQAQKEAEMFANTTTDEMLAESKSVVEKSDIILSIQREKKSFWKKLINFLLFWRKSNNFTLKVIKNSSGVKKSY